MAVAVLALAGCKSSPSAARLAPASVTKIATGPASAAPTAHSGPASSAASHAQPGSTQPGTAQAAEASSPAAPAAASASQSPQTMPASTPATPVPAGLQADGQLEVGCAVTREDGESGPVVGAELTLYNPGSAPVYVSYVGVKWNDGQVTSNVPDGNSVAPGQVVRLPLQLTVSAIAATACLAGWS
ncbi:MAG TPA: hypothetical protein VGM12_28100 [Trebonia sp.]